MGWLCYICLIHVYHIGSVTVKVFVPGEFDMHDIYQNGEVTVQPKTKQVRKISTRNICADDTFIL
jgi:cytoskeletal protein CcmA (bactofilin family)